MKKIVKVTKMRKKRISLKLSQAELASKLGLATSSIGGYERGDNPLDEKVAQSLSRILESDINGLFSPHKKLKGKFVAK